MKLEALVFAFTAGGMAIAASAAGMPPHMVGVIVAASAIVTCLGLAIAERWGGQ